MRRGSCWRYRKLSLTRIGILVLAVYRCRNPLRHEFVDEVGIGGSEDAVMPQGSVGFPTTAEVVAAVQRGAYDVLVLDFAGRLLVGDLAAMGDRAAPLCTVVTRRRHIELRLIEHVVRDVEAQWPLQATAP